MILLILFEAAIPSWVQYAAIIATLLFALATAYYAQRQHKLDKTNFKLATYDKRYEVYCIIKELVNGSNNEPSELYKILLKYDQLTKGVEYLFNDKSITNLVNAISIKASNLRHIWDELKLEDDIEKKKELRHEISETAKWFNDQNETIDKMFNKYLKL